MTMTTPALAAGAAAAALCCIAASWLAYKEGKRQGKSERVTDGKNAKKSKSAKNASKSKSATTKSKSATTKSKSKSTDRIKTPTASKPSTTSFTSLPIYPIGTLQSIYRLCVGTPRQGMLAPHSRGIVTFDETKMFKDSILELQHYSHVFVVFVFHLNSNGKVVENTFGNKDESNKDEGESGTDGKKNKSKSTTTQRQFPSKISPPSLGGKKVGVFSTRTPHRPNPIGFSLCRLDKVIVHKKKKKHKNQQQGNSFSLLLSGLDIVDGTPILDIKPYVPHYDCVGYKSPSAAVGVGVEATATTDTPDTQHSLLSESNVEAEKSSVSETATASPSTLLSENNNAQVVNSSDIVRVPHWVDSGLQKRRNVSFLPAANQFLQDLVVSEEQQSTESLSQLQFYGPHSPWKDSPEQSVEYVKQCILELLGVDVRSAWQTKKARKGKFQAERSSRLKEWKEGSGSGDGDGDNISSSNNGGGNGKHGNTSLESGSSSTGVDGEGSSSIKVKRGICTQQIDNLLVEYTIEEPGSALREKGLEVDERSMGSGAEDIVLVHLISLMK